MFCRYQDLLKVSCLFQTPSKNKKGDEFGLESEIARGVLGGRRGRFLEASHKRYDMINGLPYK